MRFAARSRAGAATTALLVTCCIHSVSEAQAPPRYVLQWGGVGANPGQFDQLQDVDLAPDGSVFVLEGKPNKRVQHFDASGASMGSWRASWLEPQALAVGADGSVFVVDYSFAPTLLDGRIIQKFSADGSPIAVWGTFGTEAGQFRARRGDRDIGPRNIGVSPSGDVYVTDPNSDRVLKFSDSGDFISEWGATGSGPGQFDSPGDVIASGAGDVYVSDRRNARIQIFSSDGTFQHSWGSAGTGPGSLASPYGMALDGDGNVLVADTLNHRIQLFSSAGAFLLEWGRTGSGDGEFDGVFKVVVNPDRNIFVLDRWNNRIQRFDAAPTAVLPVSWSAVKDLFR